MKASEKAQQIVHAYLLDIGAKEEIGIPDGSSAHKLIESITAALSERLEITKEEIDKAATAYGKDLEHYHSEYAFKTGARWYQNKLKGKEKWKTLRTPQW